MEVHRDDVAPSVDGSIGGAIVGLEAIILAYLGSARISLAGRMATIGMFC